MVTSWPKRLPGPGMSAERVAERIRALSNGRLDIQVSAAGEVVPAFDVLEAVGNGVAEMGHTASFYWQGKMAAASFFTTVPFGLTPAEHVAWIDAGGGQALWDDLYTPFGVKPFMGGNTGVCMGGWFRRELKSLADLRGLKLRSLGLGGEVYRRLGATPQTTPPAEILTSLQSGVIDGAEFVGPGTDIALGLYRVAPFYYYPGFNKPNGTGECIVALKAWDALAGRSQGDRRACLRHGSGLRACRNGAAQRAGARPRWFPITTSSSRRFPDDVVAAARKEADSVLGELCQPRCRQRQGACVLQRLPRPRGAVVAGVDRGGVAGQGVVPASHVCSMLNKAERRKKGAHYTSEKNILKVIEPLFMDDLKAEFARLKGRRDTGRMKALEDFHEKLGKLTFFDPACGCGNFLVIAYRELRELEIVLLKELHPSDQRVTDIGLYTKVNVDQFYGIEIEEFPARIAEVALWMTDHIMNARLSAAFGQSYLRIPLTTAPNIREADALEIEYQARSVQGTRQARAAQAPVSGLVVAPHHAGRSAGLSRVRRGAEPDSRSRQLYCLALTFGISVL